MIVSPMRGLLGRDTVLPNDVACPSEARLYTICEKREGRFSPTGTDCQYDTNKTYPSRSNTL